jgi:hypothetical protein
MALETSASGYQIVKAVPDFPFGKRALEFKDGPAVLNDRHHIAPIGDGFQ